MDWVSATRHCFQTHAGSRIRSSLRSSVLECVEEKKEITRNRNRQDSNGLLQEALLQVRSPLESAFFFFYRGIKSNNLDLHDRVLVPLDFGHHTSQMGCQVWSPALCVGIDSWKASFRTMYVQVEKKCFEAVVASILEK